MDTAKQQLKGSAYRDAFLHWHKQIPDSRKLYGVDIDFALIEFGSGIVACLDSKSPDDKFLTNTHREAYQWFEDRGIPVYLITLYNLNHKKCMHCGKDDVTIGFNSKISIARYSTGEVLELDNVMAYLRWERNLRKETNVT